MKIGETYYRIAVLTLTAVDNRVAVNDIVRSSPNIHDFLPHFQDVFLPCPLLTYTPASGKAILFFGR